MCHKAKWLRQKRKLKWYSWASVLSPHSKIDSITCQQPSCLYTMSPPSVQNGETAGATAFHVSFLAFNKIMYNLQI